MTSSYDAYERYHSKREQPQAAPDSVRDSAEIDDMLDSLDRVFGSTPEERAERRDRSVHALLRQIIANLDELQALADREPMEPFLARFAATARAVTLELATSGWNRSDEDGEPIEVEIGYEELHKFMMSPDLKSIEPRAS